MDIISKLKITYTVKLKDNLSETRTYSLIIESDEILDQNPNFWNLKLEEQLPIVNFFIIKHRIRYNTKEFFNQKWHK